MSLPAADDLFRGNRPMTAVPDRPEAESPDVPAPVGSEDTAAVETSEDTGSSPRRPSGRVRHAEKMTVYVTADELLEIEHARLWLRRHQSMAVDRGRLVREAIAIVLADLEANEDESVLVQRLTGR